MMTRMIDTHLDASNNHQNKCLHREKTKHLFNDSFLAKGNFCHLLITSAKSLDPDQDRQTLIVFLRKFVEKVNFEKSQQMTTKT